MSREISMMGAPPTARIGISHRGRYFLLRSDATIG
jgi:hypothetical protein